MLRWFTGLETQMKVIAILAAIGLVIIGLGAAFHLVDTAFEQAEDKGAAVERAEATGKVIENVKAANEARDAINDPRSCAMYVECLRSARATANCVRYLPDDEDCSVQSSSGAGR